MCKNMYILIALKILRISVTYSYFSENVWSVPEKWISISKSIILDQLKNMKEGLLIKKVRAGITWVNDYHPTYVEAPWGGYKQSGIGRSLGKYSLEEFQEVKQINIRLNVEPNGWFPTN